MWTTDYSAETRAEPAAVWAALRALHSGEQLSERSDKFELHGPFAKGTELSVTPQGQDTFRSRITELVDNEVYEDETSFGDVILRFRHTLARRADGGTVVTHRLEIDGTGADATGPELGPQISEDFPVAMRDLLTFAERNSAATR
jgi:hypothetical protein